MYFEFICLLRVGALTTRPVIIILFRRNARVVDSGRQLIYNKECSLNLQLWILWLLYCQNIRKVSQSHKLSLSTEEIKFEALFLKSKIVIVQSANISPKIKII